MSNYYLQNLILFSYKKAMFQPLVRLFYYLSMRLIVWWIKHETKGVYPIYQADEIDPT